MSFLKYLICLIKKDMRGFEQETEENPAMYKTVVDTLKDEKLIGEKRRKNEFHRSGQSGKSR